MASRASMFKADLVKLDHLPEEYDHLRDVRNGLSSARKNIVYAGHLLVHRVEEAIKDEGEVLSAMLRCTFSVHVVS